MITEAIIFLSYILICLALFERRFSVPATVLTFCGALAVIAGVQTVLVLFGETTLALTMLPLTAYLPFSAVLYFLSKSEAFETAAICSVGLLDVLILKSLDKITVKYTAEIKGCLPNIINYSIITAAAAFFVFFAFRSVGKNFRFCVIENRQNRLIISIPVILILLLFFYFLNSTTDVFVLIVLTLIALLEFLIIARLLVFSADYIKAKRTEREMSEHIEIQRRSYENVLRKMELGRELRHDMRHHFTVIEGLAKQGEYGKIVEYTGKISENFSETENVSYCKSPEVNAVLSEYIDRAKRAGCTVTQSILLPEKLPFDEADLCMVLANSIENAINACAALPKERRYISISVDCIEERRLLVSVRNPCGDSLLFDKEGLPTVDSQSEEHGIGLRSVKRIAEKYNGFLRCKTEYGEFVFQAAMFYGENAVPAKRSKAGTVFKRVMSSALVLILGMLITVNVLPSAAEAASSLFSVKIRTVRSLLLSWGDSSINVSVPDFEGAGADGINNAVAGYVNEATEKFIWYFNRRYNGYVAEDMRYTVIRDDNKYFTAEFVTTINAGGSMDFSRWIIFDKRLGKVISLGDLFKKNSSYIDVISSEILRQMREKNESYGGEFYIEGDGCFTGIREDVNFYIDSFDRIVIVFDEYEVAPGHMGCPEFFIPNKILEEIRRETD